MDQQTLVGLCSRQREWALGPLAKVLTAPLTDHAERVLNSSRLEACFLAGSWPRQHGLLAVLDHVTSPGSGPSAEVIDQVRRDWLGLRPEELVGRWYGQAVNGISGAFHRLGQTRASRPGVYRKLIQILGEGGRGGEAITHSANLSFDQIEALAAAPDWLRSSDLLRIPLHKVQALSVIARALAKTVPAIDLERLRRLPRMVAGGDLANELLEIGVSLPLPVALQPLDERLVQIRSIKDLHLMASKFKNCIRYHAQPCLDGIAAFYVWTGSEEAVVQLQKVIGAVWVVDDIRGPNNCDVSSHTRELIRRSFPRDDGEMIYEGLWPENLIL